VLAFETTSYPGRGMARLYSSFAGDNASDSDSEGLQEVIVTRAIERLSAQNLPISITAVRAPTCQAGESRTWPTGSFDAAFSITDKGPFSGVNGAKPHHSGLNSETTSGCLPPPRRSCPRWLPMRYTPLFFNLRLQTSSGWKFCAAPR